jgi:hypothetical protein
MTNLVNQLTNVAVWLENGCEPAMAAKELRTICLSVAAEAADELAHREKYAAQMNEVLKENARLMHDIEAGSAEIAKYKAWAASCEPLPCPKCLIPHYPNCEQQNAIGEAMTNLELAEKLEKAASEFSPIQYGLLRVIREVAQELRSAAEPAADTTVEVVKLKAIIQCMRLSTEGERLYQNAIGLRDAIRDWPAEPTK